MKKLFATLLALALVICAASGLAEGIKLGIVTPDADHGFTGESVAHARAEAEAQEYDAQYRDLTGRIKTLRLRRRELLQSAPLPLEGLPVEQGELTYHGCRWDCMSGAEQLRAATAIVRAAKPQCGFVLIDKLEQMDLKTMQEFGQWLKSQNLQAIATRVSRGSECTIIIEDGQVAGQSLPEIPAPNPNIWKAGVF